MANADAEQWDVTPFTLFSAMIKWTGTSEAARIGLEEALGNDRGGVTIGALLELTMDDLNQAMMDARVMWAIIALCLLWRRASSDLQLDGVLCSLADQLPLGEASPLSTLQQLQRQKQLHLHSVRGKHPP
eukprot:992064-Amphidinium_carterae.1